MTRDAPSDEDVERESEPFSFWRDIVGEIVAGIVACLVLAGIVAGAAAGYAQAPRATIATGTAIVAFVLYGAVSLVRGRGGALAGVAATVALLAGMVLLYAWSYGCDC